AALFSRRMLRGRAEVAVLHQMAPVWRMLKRRLAQRARCLPCLLLVMQELQIRGGSAIFGTAAAGFGACALIFFGRQTLTTPKRSGCARYSRAIASSVR